jgi:hypothetical protein
VLRSSFNCRFNLKLNEVRDLYYAGWVGKSREGSGRGLLQSTVLKCCLRTDGNCRQLWDSIVDTLVKIWKTNRLNSSIFCCVNTFCQIVACEVLRITRNAYRILEEKYFRKCPLGRPRMRWEDNIKWTLGQYYVRIGVIWNWTRIVSSAVLWYYQRWTFELWYMC